MPMNIPSQLCSDPLFKMLEEASETSVDVIHANSLFDESKKEEEEGKKTRIQRVLQNLMNACYSLDDIL